MVTPKTELIPEVYGRAQTVVSGSYEQLNEVGERQAIQRVQPR
jgi:hypothetical protein